MSQVTAPPPLQLILGARGHGVVDYAADVAAALTRLDGRTRIAVVGELAEAVERAAASARTHLHVTDRLLGRSPEQAADNLERLARVTDLTITVHDVPQTSDGGVLPRRVAAYSRFFAAARAVAVNSRHEQHLVSEFLTPAGEPRAIPLGSRVGTAPEHAAGADQSSTRDGRELVVLLAGYVYPGKGHAHAIRSAADAAELLRAEGRRVGRVVVRAIGGPSAGHEADVDDLRADADLRGVRFDVTGFLDDAAFARRIGDDGIPLAAHEHVSASRSMLDWVEAGRRPLVVASRYAEEMAQLRPGTMTTYERDELPARLADAWRNPASTRLRAGTSLAPSLADVAEAYRMWWAEMDPR